MKKLAFIIGILCCSVSISIAQDVITLRTGEVRNVKIWKVGNVNIEYKKVDKENSTLYEIAKEDVHTIEYENGKIDTLNAKQKIVEDQWYTLNVEEQRTDKKVENLQQDYDINLDRSKRCIRTGIICTSFGIPMIAGGCALLAVGVPLAKQYYDSPIPTSNLEYMGMVVSGWILLTGGVVSSAIGPREIARGVKYKRWAKEAKAKLSFVPSVTPANGVVGTQTGLAMRITF